MGQGPMSIVKISIEKWKESLQLYYASKESQEALLNKTSFSFVQEFTTQNIDVHKQDMPPQRRKGLKLRKMLERFFYVYAADETVTYYHFNEDKAQGVTFKASTIYSLFWFLNKS